MRLLVPAAALLLLPGAASPCSICAAGDPLIAASDAPSQSGQLRFGLEGEWQRAEAGSDDDPAALEELTQQTARLVVVYAPWERVNLVGSVPWVQKVLRSSEGGSETRSGIGDLEVGGRWFFFRRTEWGVGRRHAAALSLGTSLPSGAADARDGGLRLDDHAQIGTGAFGPYAGIFYRLEQLDWDLFASVTGRWRTENRWGFRFGPALTWSLQGQWTPTERLALGVGVDGRQAGRDEEDGSPLENTGGLVLAATPGAWVGVTEELWLSLRAQLPIATALHGVQDVGPVLLFGLQWSAH